MKVPAARDVGIVIPAAGSGVRFGRPKALIDLGGRPLFLHSVLAFSAVEEVAEIVVASVPADIDGIARVLRERAGDVRAACPGREPPRVSAVPGGARRQDSVWSGLRALSPAVRAVLVHDAARPLIRPADIRKVIGAVREEGAAVLGWPATDSVKEERDGRVARELPRGHVWLVQTPQGAAVEVLRKAFEDGERAGLEVTDEVGLIFASGAPVRLVEGARTNIKITFPEDLALAEFLLAARK